MEVGVSGFAMHPFVAEPLYRGETKRKPFEKHPLTLEEGGYVLDITSRNKNGSFITRSQKNVKYPMKYIQAVIEQNPHLVEISHDGNLLWHCDSPRAIKHLDNWSEKN